MPHVTLADLYQQWGSSEKGLTNEQARKRLAQYGPNETTTVKQVSPIRRILSGLANPLVLILLAASGVSAILSQLRARLAGAEEPHYPGTQVAQARRWLHGQRHQ